MAELKPCPFCGGTKLKIERKSRLAGCNLRKLLGQPAGFGGGCCVRVRSAGAQTMHIPQPPKGE